MKTLQSDFTTQEQSKRLLELGVPKNSANHYYGKDGKLHYIDGKIPYSLLWETGCTPCWSVGRLCEILNLCSNDTTHCLIGHISNVNIQKIIKLFELETEKIDFLKLED